MATPSGATAIIGWIDGTRWLTFPMSVEPINSGRSAFERAIRPRAAMFEM